jgi:prevent-host-death family protein
MMKTIGAFEAKTHLSGLLDQAAAGERITITRQGRPVAVLVPFEDEPRMTPEEAVAAFRALRARITLGDDPSLGDLIDEGR